MKERLKNVNDVEYHNIVKKGEKFTDPYFPPDERSLLLDRNTQHFKEMNHDLYMHYSPWAEDLIWKRPSDVFGENSVILYDSIDASDVVQGISGNAYFTASIRAIAEKEDRIADNFITREKNTAGIYMI